MFDFSDADTPISLRELDRLVRRGDSIVIWVGAGASRWAGYGSWEQVARRVHKAFLKRVPKYDRDTASRLAAAKDWPALFDLCSSTDRARYLECLLESLTRGDPVAPYPRFLAALQNLYPLQVVTTNVDEELEHGVRPAPQVFQNTDLERLADCLRSRTAFIAKLHGTLSQAASMVFSGSDYGRITSDATYTSAVRNLFYNAHVVFLGYGLADEYVLRLLGEVDSSKNLFGDGPHFLVASSEHPLPSSVLRIRYRAEATTDHRSAIQVLEDISWIQKRVAGTITPSPEPPPVSPSARPQSAHLLADFFAPGTWETSLTLRLAREGQPSSAEAIVGEGWSIDELRFPTPTALHDLVVGLICFDTVYAPVSAIARLYSVLRDPYLEELLRVGALRMINWRFSPTVLFPLGDLAGDLAVHRLHGPDGNERSTMDMVHRLLRPSPGKEKDAQRVYDLILSTSVFVENDAPVPLPERVLGLTIRPPIRNLLGIADGVPAVVVPRWSTFPVLRLARLVQLAETCQRMGIVSMRVPYGIPELIGPSFAATIGPFWADTAARFVLSGRFDTDLGVYVASNSDVLKTLLTFRDTESAVRLRREVLSRIESSAGAEIAVAIDGALRSAIPHNVLQQAHDQMAGLLTRGPTPGTSFGPAVWNDTSFGMDRLRAWKRRSLGMLESFFAERNLPRDAPCPCGSGELIKDCCRATLRAGTRDGAKDIDA